ncbi:MAG: SEL1-like repeat protein [Gammaproteobacteria bacterium]
MANLQVLRLLRNDPEAAAEMLAAAEQGDMDAQYAMGLIYAEGRGVAQDEVMAHYWLSRAIEQGDVDAQTLLQIVAFSMTDAQYKQAGRLLDAYHDGDGRQERAPGRKSKDLAGRRMQH